MDDVIKMINTETSISPLEGAYTLLSHHNKFHTIAHSRAVGNQAEVLAIRYGMDPSKCQIAGALHDISVIIPPKDRLHVAESHGLDILPEEQQFTLLLHQKLSALIAREIFHIHDNEVLSAIQCHTTLKPHASDLDLLLFVADKIAWDGQGAPPWQDVLREGLDHSLHHGALAYIDYLLHSGDLLIPHPWLVAAHADLLQQIP